MKRSAFNSTTGASSHGNLGTPNPIQVSLRPQGHCPMDSCWKDHLCVCVFGFNETFPPFWYQKEANRKTRAVFLVGPITKRL